MSTDLIIAELKIEKEHVHVYKGGDACLADDCENAGIRCEAKRRGLGDSTVLAFPCGLSITQQLVQEVAQNYIDQINRVHLRHHELGHPMHIWTILETVTRDDESQEVTQVHMTCSDMGG